MSDKERREYFLKIVSNVDIIVEKIRSIPDNLMYDEAFMEKFIIEKVGLNNESLWEQPLELSPYYGTGLYSKSNGKIFINGECRHWYKMFIKDIGLSFIMDGDLPKADYFTNDFSPLLSDSDNAIHTVIPGRPVGIELKTKFYMRIIIRAMP
jgi:hypothetical protein